MKKHGSLAKWLPPWLKAAILSACKIINFNPEDKQMLLFESVMKPDYTNKKRYVDTNRTLKRWHNEYMDTKTYEFQEATFIRKLFHTRLEEEKKVVASTSGASLEGLCKADGHGKGLALRTYVLNKHKIQVAEAAAVYKEVYGSLEYPTAGEAQQAGFTPTSVFGNGTEGNQTLDEDGEDDAAPEDFSDDFSDLSDDDEAKEPVETPPKPVARSVKRAAETETPRSLERHRTVATTPPPQGRALGRGKRAAFASPTSSSSTPTTPTRISDSWKLEPPPIWHDVLRNLKKAITKPTASQSLKDTHTLTSDEIKNVIMHLLVQMVPSATGRPPSPSIVASIAASINAEFKTELTSQAVGATIDLVQGAHRVVIAREKFAKASADKTDKKDKKNTNNQVVIE